MINIKSRIKINGSVLYMEAAGDKLVVLDSLYNLYLLESEQYTFEKTVNITKNHESWHRYGKGMAASRDGHVNIALTKSTKSIVLAIGEQIKKKAVLNWHKADVFISAFSADSKLLATGGEDGKTLIFSMPSCHLQYSLFPKPDYISNISFSANSHMVMSSGFDMTTTVVDLERNRELAEFTTEAIVEDGCFVENDHKIFYACKDGSTGIYSIREHQNEHHQKHSETWYTCLEILPGGKFAVVAGKAEHLYVIRVSDNALMFSIKTSHVGVSQLRILGEHLLVGYIDGVIEVIDVWRYSDEVDIHLKVNDFEKAREVTEKNMFLKIYDLYTEKLAEGWKEILQKAVDLLAKNDVKVAMEQVAPFIEDPKRKEEFSYYMAQRQHVADFMDAIEVRDFVKAYQLAKENPEIKELSGYEELEAYWHKVFDAAKKLLSINAQLNVNKAKEILKPFTNVREKKDMVITLLTNTDKYVAADKALKERKFADYFRLAEKFTFLKETEMYKKTLMLGEQLVEKGANLENQREFGKAQDAMKILATLAPFKQTALERIEQINKKVAFLQALEKKEMVVAYDYIQQNPDLKSMPEFIEMTETFKALSEKAFSLAFVGRARDVMTVLKDYLSIQYWDEKIASIMKVAYLNEIRKTAADENESQKVEWKKTLQEFIERFGKSDELERVAEMSKIKGVLDGISEEGDAQGYQNVSYLTTILAMKE